MSTAMDELMTKAHNRMKDEICELLECEDWTPTHVEVFAKLIKSYSHLLGIKKWYSEENTSAK